MTHNSDGSEPKKTDNILDAIGKDLSSKDLDTLQLIADSLKNTNKQKQDHKNSQDRLEITKIFLKWYFGLIAGSFIFSALYNFIVAYINTKLPSAPIDYLDVFNTVSIITSTLSGGMGFVIGYYFKNKEEK